MFTFVIEVTTVVVAGEVADVRGVELVDGVVSVGYVLLVWIVVAVNGAVVFGDVIRG